MGRRINRVDSITGRIQLGHRNRITLNLGPALVKTHLLKRQSLSLYSRRRSSFFKSKLVRCKLRSQTPRGQRSDNFCDLTASARYGNPGSAEFSCNVGEGRARPASIGYCDKEAGRDNLVDARTDCLNYLVDHDFSHDHECDGVGFRIADSRPCRNGATKRIPVGSSIENFRYCASHRDGCLSSGCGLRRQTNCWRSCATGNHRRIFAG